MSGLTGFVPLHGRHLIDGATTRVHRNLNKRDDVWWSLSQGGRVIGHALGVVLADAKPHVGLSAQQRIAGGANREVHAWVVGTLTSIPAFDALLLAKVSYRPHQRPEFFYEYHPDQEWTGSEYAVFGREGLYA